jgi:hypothetical protein
VNKLGSNSYVFWVTNHTTNDLAIVISSVQARIGPVWSNCFAVHETLLFPSKTAPTPIPNLVPRWAGTSIVALPGLPSAGPWRLQALVTERLHGVEEASRDLVEYRRRMEIRRATGDTNITMNPFTQTIPVYGHPREAFSEPVAQ